MGRQVAGLAGVGRAVRPVAARLGMRRPPAQWRADRVLLPAAARELAVADRGELQRRLLGGPGVLAGIPSGVRRRFTRNVRTFSQQALERHAVPLLPE